MRDDCCAARSTAALSTFLHLPLSSPLHLLPSFTSIPHLPPLRPSRSYLQPIPSTHTSSSPLHINSYLFLLLDGACIGEYRGSTSRRCQTPLDCSVADLKPLSTHFPCADDYTIFQSLSHNILLVASTSTTSSFIVGTGCLISPSVSHVPRPPHHHLDAKLSHSTAPSTINGLRSHL